MRLAILFIFVIFLTACGGGDEESVDLSPPKISSQPSSVNAYETQTVSFEVAASTSHDQLSYQWFKNGDAIAGATDKTMVLDALSIDDDQALFTVRVSNGTSVTSVPASLSIKPAAPNILTSPTEQSIDAGQTATFTVTADGLPPLTYQWYKNGTAIPGAVSTQYTTPVQAVEDSGAIYSVQVTNPLSDAITSDDASITVTDPNLKHLVISEVSVCVAYTDGCWFEIYNPTSQAIDLSQYKVKSTSTSATGSAINTFNLPAITMGAGAYQVVSGNTIKEQSDLKDSSTITTITLEQRGNFVAMLNSNGYVPDWSYDGFIELLDGTTGGTVDFVKFDASTQIPTTVGFWTGTAVQVLPHNPANYGKSVVRHYPINTNTRTSTDWTLAPWVTPGGRNDISPTATDKNGDGIPGGVKTPGATFGGLDLYAMGGRTGKKDIFIEIDYMDSTDPGVIPRKESLQMVVDAFAKHDIAVHFDAGTLFSPTFNPALFNLGQGDSKVPYEKCVAMNQKTCASNTSSRKSIYDWKQEFMDPRRRPIFHYLLMGNSRFDNEPAVGSSGYAEIEGNDMIVTMGKWGFTTATPLGLQILINQQAAAIMHELGHNLGLRHGGDENLNYKPNYTSVMNYLYQNLGQEADLSSPTAYQRWLFYYNNLNKVKNNIERCNLQNSPCENDFVINYSNGAGKSLNENNLLEEENIGHGAATGAYADWNKSGGLTAGAISLDLNPDGGTAGRSVLHDYNDWANLKLPFNRVAAGNFAASLSTPQTTAPLAPNSVINDRQTSIAEDAPSQDLIDFIRSTR